MLVSHPSTLRPRLSYQKHCQGRFLQRDSSIASGEFGGREFHENLEDRQVDHLVQRLDDVAGHVSGEL